MKMGLKMAAAKIVMALFSAYLVYDHYTSVENESHIDGIGSFLSVTSGALQGRTPACTLEGNGLIYWALVGEAFTMNKETAEEVADLHRGAGVNLAGQVVIITGASNGIGVETARVMLLQGMHVVMAVRNKQKGEKVAAELLQDASDSGKLPKQAKVTVLACDLSDLSSVKAFAEQFLVLSLPLHQLVNNAGIMMLPTYELTADGYEKQWAVDHLGHFLLTTLLLPTMRTTAAALTAAQRQSHPVRVINLASTAHYTADSLEPARDLPPQADGYNPVCSYGVAKMSNMLYTLALQEPGYEGMLAAAVHPGVVRTGLCRENRGFTRIFWDSGVVGPMTKTTEQGAATTIHCSMSPSLGHDIQGSALAFADVKVWEGIHRTARDAEKAEALHKLSMDAVAKYL